MSQTTFLSEPFTVDSPDVTYTDSTIESRYRYTSSVVSGSRVRVKHEDLVFRTERVVPKTGVMLVGWGGNNGSTVTAGILANKLGLSWRTKEGVVQSNYFGSLTQASTVRLGLTESGESVYVPFGNILPTVNPNDFVLGGWDISSANLAQAMERARVLDYDLQRQLEPHMAKLKPLPSVYIPDFIAANQQDRADNVLVGTRMQHVETIRGDIRAFKEANGLDKVIVLWTANTERFSSVEVGLNTTAAELLASIEV